MLEHELRELAVEWPETPDIAGSLVLSRPAPRRRRGRIAAVAVALLVGTVMAVPPTRAAVLDFFGLSSTVRVVHREPAVSHFGSGLLLGDPVSLETARRRAGFPLHVPTTYGEPDSVYLGDNPRRVDMLWRARSGLPRASTTGAGLLVTELLGTATPAIQKTQGSATHFEELTVRGRTAYFFSGRGHGFAYLPPGGAMGFEDQRLAGNTLLVELADGVLLRVEGNLSRDEAVRVAETAAG